MYMYREFLFTVDEFFVFTSDLDSVGLATNVISPACIQYVFSKSVFVPDYVNGCVSIVVHFTNQAFFDEFKSYISWCCSDDEISCMLHDWMKDAAESLRSKVCGE